MPTGSPCHFPLSVYQYLGYDLVDGDAVLVLGINATNVQFIVGCIFLFLNENFTAYLISSPTMLQDFLKNLAL